MRNTFNMYSVELKEDRDNPKVTLIKDMGRGFRWITDMTPMQAESVGNELINASLKARGFKCQEEK